MDHGRGQGAHGGGQNYPGRRTREERRSLSESLADGTSKFFSSMVAKKNGLFSDISSKIENTFAPKTDTISNATESERSSPTTPPAPNTPPPRPPPPKRIPSMGSSREKENVIKRMSSMPAYTRTDSRPEDAPETMRNQHGNHTRASSEDRFSVNGMNISFDEPIIYTSRETLPASTHASGNDVTENQNGRLGHNAKNEAASDSSSAHPRPAPRSQKPSKTGDAVTPTHNRHPDADKGVNVNNRVKDTALSHGNSADRLNENQLLEEVKQMSSEMIRLTENVQKSDMSQTFKKSDSDSGGSDRGGSDRGGSDSADDTHVRQKAPMFTNTKRRSSTVDEMLFDDYVEPEIDAVFSAEVPPENLICFEPEPEIIVNSPDSSVEGNERMLAGTSIDSSDVEYGGTTVHRSASVGSEKSWSSNYSVDSQPDDVTLESIEFMKHFVDKVFHPSEDISQTEKAKFGELCQHFPGRLWFSRCVNSQRVHNKRVIEPVFFRLMQYFAVCLFECNEAEDFSPAKTLMNMCFTFYYEAPTSHGVPEKIFLYAYMRDQPIWQSLRFWNAAFFDAVQCERSRRPMPTNTDGNETVTDDKQFQENITFGQLGTFACNMRAFGLSKELCLEFLRKQSTIANLRKDQVKLLKDNIERVKEN